jgi:hypothetical protein
MVRLAEIVFENRNAIDVVLTVEAPIDRPVVTRHLVPSQSTYRVSPGVEDCRSVLLEVADGTHSSARQEFSLASPSAGQPSYIAHLTAHHVIGSIRGVVVARTDGADTTDDEFLRDVERDHLGRAVGLSRWGWKKVSVDGKAVLVAQPAMKLSRRSEPLANQSLRCCSTVAPQEIRTT